MGAEPLRHSACLLAVGRSCPDKLSGKSCASYKHTGYSSLTLYSAELCIGESPCFYFILLYFLFCSILFFTDRLVDRRASSDKSVEPHAAPQTSPAEDPFGSVPFISQQGKFHL